MSLLQSIITQVAQNAINHSAQPQARPQSGLGDILGQVLGGQPQAQQSGLGGLLGSLLGGQAQNQRATPSDLGDVLGSLLGSQSQMQSRQAGFNKSTLLLALLPIVLGYIQKNGGLSGVLSKFQGNGLENKAQSWVNIDQDNDGIDAADVARLFDSKDIAQACTQTGASEQEVCQGIAELLPQVVNDLTPKGSLDNEQQANDEIDEILAQLKGKF